ncbi:WAP domain-containing protein [Trichonephila clavata]|uniref:WAP domain-containing protein n=1 Tax=Trichonephila clavata TaxID=2740835 RepID=A0A8X6KPD3_TRICU|nr:WAP domain-containing protein [Trichonephila clavata]
MYMRSLQISISQCTSLMIKALLMEIGFYRCTKQIRKLRPKDLTRSPFTAIVWKCPEPPPTLCFYSTYDYNCKSHDECPGYQMCCLFGCAYGCVRPLPVPPVALETYDEEDMSPEEAENNLVDTGPQASEMKNRNILSENGLDASGLNSKGNLIDTAFHTSIVHVKNILMGIGSKLSIVDIKDNLIDTDSHRSRDGTYDNLIDIGVSTINYRDNLTDTKSNISAIHIDNNTRFNTSVADIKDNLTNTGIGTSANHYRNKFINNELEISTINIDDDAINIEFNTLTTDINNNFTDTESNSPKTNIDNILIGTGIHSSTMDTNDNLSDTELRTSTTPLINLTDIEFYFSRLQSPLLPHAPEDRDKGYEEDKNQSQMQNNQNSNIRNAANKDTFKLMIYHSKLNKTNENFYNKPPQIYNATDSGSTVSQFKNKNGEENADTDPSLRNTKIRHDEFMQSNNIHNLFSENPTITTRFQIKFYSNLENKDITVKKKLLDSNFKGFIAEDYIHIENNSQDSDCNSSKRKKASMKSNDCNFYRKMNRKNKNEEMIKHANKQKNTNDERDLKTTTLQMLTPAHNFMKEDETKAILHHQKPEVLPLSSKSDEANDDTPILQNFNKVKTKFESLGESLMQLLNAPTRLQKINATLLHRISNSIVESLTEIDKNLTLNEEVKDLKTAGAPLLQFLSKIIQSSKLNETLMNSIYNVIAGSTAKQYKSLTSGKEVEDLERIGKRILQIFSRTIPSEKINKTVLNIISNVIVDYMVDYDSFLASGEDEDLKTTGVKLLQFLSQISPLSKINETLMNSISNVIVDSMVDRENFFESGEDEDLKTTGVKFLQFLSQISPSSKINETLLNSVSNLIEASTAKHYKSLTSGKEEETLERIGKRILQIFSSIIPLEKINKTLLNSISNVIVDSMVDRDNFLVSSEDKDLKTIGVKLLQFLSQISPSSKINETLMNSISNVIAASTAKHYKSLTSGKEEEDLGIIAKKILQIFSRTIPSEKINKTLLNSISNVIVDSMVDYDSFLASGEDEDLKTTGVKLLQFLSQISPLSKINETLMNSISNVIVDSMVDRENFFESGEDEDLKTTGVKLLQFLSQISPSSKINETLMNSISNVIVDSMVDRGNFFESGEDEDLKTTGVKLLQFLSQISPLSKINETLMNSISNVIVDSMVDREKFFESGEDEDLKTTGVKLLQFLSQISPSSKINETLMNSISIVIVDSMVDRENFFESGEDEDLKTTGVKLLQFLSKIIPSSKINETLLNSVSNLIEASTAKHYKSLTSGKEEEALERIEKRILQIFSSIIPLEKINKTLLNSISNVIVDSMVDRDNFLVSSEDKDLKTIGVKLLQFLSQISPSSKINETFMNSISNVIAASTAKHYKSLTSGKEEEDLERIAKKILQIFSRTIPSEKINKTLLNSISNVIVDSMVDYDSFLASGEDEDLKTTGVKLLQFLSHISPLSKINETLMNSISNVIVDSMVDRENFFESGEDEDLKTTGVKLLQFLSQISPSSKINETLMNSISNVIVDSMVDRAKFFESGEDEDLKTTGVKLLQFLSQISPLSKINETLMNSISNVIVDSMVDRENFFESGEDEDLKTTEVKLLQFLSQISPSSKINETLMNSISNVIVDSMVDRENFFESGEDEDLKTTGVKLLQFLSKIIPSSKINETLLNSVSNLIEASTAKHYKSLTSGKEEEALERIGKRILQSFSSIIPLEKINKTLLNSISNVIVDSMVDRDNFLVSSEDKDLKTIGVKLLQFLSQISPSSKINETLMNSISNVIAASTAKHYKSLTSGKEEEDLERIAKKILQIFSRTIPSEKINKSLLNSISNVIVDSMVDYDSFLASGANEYLKTIGVKIQQFLARIIPSSKINETLINSISNVIAGSTAKHYKSLTSGKEEEDLEMIGRRILEFFSKTIPSEKINETLLNRISNVIVDSMVDRDNFFESGEDDDLNTTGVKLLQFLSKFIPSSKINETFMNSISNVIAGSTAKHYKSSRALKEEEDLERMGKRILQIFSRTIPSENNKILLNSIPNVIVDYMVDYDSFLASGEDEDLKTTGVKLLQFLSQISPSSKINETLMNSISNVIVDSMVDRENFFESGEDEDLKATGVKLLQFLSKIIPSSKINETLLNSVSNLIEASTAKHYKSLTSGKEEETLERIGKRILQIFSSTIPSEKINKTLLNSISNVIVDSMVDRDNFLVSGEDEDLKTIGVKLLQFLSQISPSSKINETLMNSISNVIAASTAKHYKSLTSGKEEEDLERIAKKILQIFSRTSPSEKINKTLLNSISNVIVDSMVDYDRFLESGENEYLKTIGVKLQQFLSKIIPSSKINETLINSISNVIAGSTAKHYKSLTSGKEEEDLEIIGKRILEFFSKTIPSEKINKTLLNRISNVIVDSMVDRDNFFESGEDDDLKTTGVKLLQFLSKIIPSSKINETFMNSISNVIAGSTAKHYKSSTALKKEEDLERMGKRILQIFSRTIPSENNKTLLNSIPNVIVDYMVDYDSFLASGEDEDLKTTGVKLLQFLSQISPSSKINETLMNSISNVIVDSMVDRENFFESGEDEDLKATGVKLLQFLSKIIPSSKINETLLNSVSNLIEASTAKHYKSLTSGKEEETLERIGKRILQIFSSTIPSEKIYKTLLNSISNVIVDSMVDRDNFLVSGEDEDLKTIGVKLLQFLSQISPSSKINETLMNSISNVIAASTAKHYKSLTSGKEEEDLQRIAKKTLQIFSRTSPSEKINKTLLNSISNVIVDYMVDYDRFLESGENEYLKTIGVKLQQFLSRIIPSSKINETLINSISNVIAGSTAKHYKSLTSGKEEEDLEMIGKRILEFFSKTIPSEKINETLLKRISNVRVDSMVDQYNFLASDEDEDLKTIGVKLLQFLSQISPLSKINETLMNSISNVIVDSMVDRENIFESGEDEDLKTTGVKLLQFLSKIIPSSNINETMLNRVSNVIEASTAKHYKSLTSGKEEEALERIGKRILQIFSSTIPSEKINKTVLNSISNVIVDSMVDRDNFLVSGEYEDLKTIGVKLQQFLSRIIPSSKIKETLMNSISNVIAGSTAKHFKSLTSGKEEEDLEMIGKRILEFFSKTILSEKINETLLNKISNVIVDSMVNRDNFLASDEEEDLKTIVVNLLQFLSRIIPSSKINETFMNSISNVIAGSTAKHYKSSTALKEEEDLERIGKRILQIFSRTIPSEKINITLLNSISNVIVDSMVDRDNFLASGEDEYLKTIGVKLQQFLSRIIPSSKIKETLMNSISNVIAGSTAKHFKSLTSGKEEEDLEMIGKRILEFFSKTILSEKINETLLNKISNVIVDSMVNRDNFLASDEEEDLKTIVVKLLQFLSRIIPSSKINESMTNSISNVIAGSTAKRYKSLTSVKEKEDLEMIGKRILQFFSKTMPSPKINKTLLNSICNAIVNPTAKQYRSLTSVKEKEDWKPIGKRILQFFSKSFPSEKINETILDSICNVVVNSIMEKENFIVSGVEDKDLKTLGVRLLQFLSRVSPSSKIHETMLNSISQVIAGSTTKHYNILTSVKEEEDVEAIRKIFSRTVLLNKINETLLNKVLHVAVDSMINHDNYLASVEGDGNLKSIGKWVLQFFAMFLKDIFNSVLDWVEGFNIYNKEDENLTSVGERLVQFLWRSIPSRKTNKTLLKNISDSVVQSIGGKDNDSMLVADDGYEDPDEGFVLIEKRLLKFLVQNLSWVKGSERAFNKISNSVIWLDVPFNSSVLNVKQVNLKDAAGIDVLRKRLLNFFTGIIPSMAGDVKLTNSKSSYRNVHTYSSNSELAPPATYFPNFPSKSNDSHVQIQRSDIAFRWFGEQVVPYRTVVQQDHQKVSNTNDDQLRTTVTKNVSDRINQNRNIMYLNPILEKNIDDALHYEKGFSYIQDFDALTDTSLYTSPVEVWDVIKISSAEPTSTGFRTEIHEFTNERLGYRAVKLFELLSSFISPKGISDIQPTTESSDTTSPLFSAPFTQMNNDKFEKRIQTLSTLNTMPISEFKDFNYPNIHTMFYEIEPSTTLVNNSSSSRKVTEKPKLGTSDVELLRFWENFNSRQEISDNLSSTLAKSYYSFFPLQNWYTISPITANQNMNSLKRIEASDTSLDQNLKEGIHQKSQLLYRNPEQGIAFVTTSTDANSIYSNEDTNTYLGGKNSLKNFFTQSDRVKLGKQHSIIFNKGNFHGAIQIKLRKNSSSSSSKSTIKISTSRKDTFNKEAPLKTNNGSLRKEGLDFKVGEYVDNDVERSLSNTKNIDLYNQDQRRNSNNAFYSQFEEAPEHEKKHLKYTAIKRVRPKHSKSNSEWFLPTKYHERDDFHLAIQLKQRSHLTTEATEKEPKNKINFHKIKGKRGNKIHSNKRENKRLSLEGYENASSGGNGDFRITNLDNFKNRKYSKRLKLSKNEFNDPKVIFRKMETIRTTSDPSQNALNRPNKKFHKTLLNPTSKKHLKNTPTERWHPKIWRDRIQNLLDPEIVRYNAEFPSGRLLLRHQEIDEKSKVISSKETKNKLKTIKIEIKNTNRIQTNKLRTRHWEDMIHDVLQEQKESEESFVTPLHSNFEEIQIQDKTVDKASNKKIHPKHWKNVVQDIVGGKKKSTSKNKSNEMLTKFKTRVKNQKEKQLGTTHFNEYENRNNRMDDYGTDFEFTITSSSKNELSLSRAMDRKQKNHLMEPDFYYYPIKGNGVPYADILTTALSKKSYRKKGKYEKHPISSTTQLSKERRNYSFRIRQKNHDRDRENQSTRRNKYPTSRTLAEKQNQPLESDFYYYPIKGKGVRYPDILATTYLTERKGKYEKHPISLTPHIFKDVDVKKNLSFRTGYYNSDLENKSNENTISRAPISEQKELYKEPDIYNVSIKNGGVSTNILKDIYTALEKKISSNNSLHASQRIHEGFNLQNSKIDNALLVQYLPDRVNSENLNNEINEHKEVGVSKPKLYEIGSVALQSKSHKNNFHWPMESKDEISKEKYWWYKLLASPTTSQSPNTNSYKNFTLKENVTLHQQLNEHFIIEDTTPGRNTTVLMNFRRKNNDLEENGFHFESNQLFTKQLEFKSETSNPPTTVPYLVHLLGQLMKEEAEYVKKNRQETVAGRNSKANSTFMYSNDGRKRNDIGSLAQNLKPNLIDEDKSDLEDEGRESADLHWVTIKEPLQNVKPFHNNSTESFLDKLLLKFMEEEKQFIGKKETLEKRAEYFIEGKSFTKTIDKNISKTTTKNIITDKNLYETKDKGTLKKSVGSVFKMNAKYRSKNINNKTTVNKSRSKGKNENIHKNIYKANDKNSSKTNDSNILKENIKKGPRNDKESRKAKAYNTSKTVNRDKSKQIHKNISKTGYEKLAKIVDDNIFKIGSKNPSNTKNKKKYKVNNKIISKAKAIVRLPSADVLVSELLNKEKQNYKNKIYPKNES